MADTPLPEVPAAQLRRLTEADAPALDALSARCADFTRLVEGREPAEGDGLEMLTEAPPDFPLARKTVLGVYAGGELIGAIDLLDGYPRPGIWYLGLLLLAPERRGAGLGAELYAVLRDWVRGQGANAIHLSVQSQNVAGLRFWKREGFVEIDTVVREQGVLINRIHRMKHEFAA